MTSSSGLDTTVNNPTERQPVARYLPKWDVAALELIRVSTCGTFVNWWKHEECDSAWPVPISCNSRWCSRCAARRAEQIVERYMPSVSQFRRPALVTLTVPNCHQGWLALYLTVLSEALKRLRRSNAWTAKDGIYAIEVKWSKSKGFHPHIHMLVNWEWTDLQELSRTWRRITEKLFRDYGHPLLVKHQPDVKWVRGKNILYALGEVVKYACGVKRGQAGSEFPHYPYSVQLEIAAALSGTRMVQPFGHLKAVPKLKYSYYCPHCGKQYHMWEHASKWDRQVMSTQEVASTKRVCTWLNFYDGWVKVAEHGET